MTHNELEVRVFVEQSFGENAYVLSALSADALRSERVAWIIDPSFPPAVDELLDYTRDQELGVEKIILTHGHADHIAGLDRAKAAHPQAQVWMPQSEAAMLQDAWLNLSAV